MNPPRCASTSEPGLSPSKAKSMTPPPILATAYFNRCERSGGLKMDWAVSSPTQPMTIPEAPRLRWSANASHVATLPPAPARYAASRPQPVPKFPIVRPSKTNPRLAFVAKWPRSACRKTAVNNRHHCPCETAVESIKPELPNAAAECVWIQKNKPTRITHPMQPQSNKIPFGEIFCLQIHCRFSAR